VPVLYFLPEILFLEELLNEKPQNQLLTF